VRERAGREPSRTARQAGQAQFHCGYPPPAADPSTRTHMPIRRLPYVRIVPGYREGRRAHFL